MSDHSTVRQDCETYTSLELLHEGIAEQLKPRFPGDIIFQFKKSNSIVRFRWIFSVLYCDEILWTRYSYPYFKDVGGKNGLFLVHGSSYLERVKPFCEQSHYIYFDGDFNWHITAKGIEVLPIGSG